MIGESSLNPWTLEFWRVPSFPRWVGSALASNIDPGEVRVGCERKYGRRSRAGLGVRHEVMKQRCTIWRIC